MARQVGYSRALQLCIEAERIPAGRCVELGLANKIAPAAQLQEAALAWAGQLAARPTAAIGWTKHALHNAAELALEEAISLEADLQAMAIATQDHREGVAAFLQKRAPRFVGQ
jgi:2-(1,2-epoxy-1,2-dihydrophenyl)acetyl-CoA isomerase